MIKTKVTGKVLKVEAEKAVTETFRKRGVLIDTKHDYDPNTLVEFVQDGCSKLDGIKVGDEVEINVDIVSKEHNGRYFHNVKGWSISVTSAAVAPKKGAPVESSGSDELPF